MTRFSPTKFLAPYIHFCIENLENSQRITSSKLPHAHMESLLTSAFFRDLRDFWFENVDRDNLVVAFTGKQQERWFAKGRDIDEACR